MFSLQKTKINKGRRKVSTKPKSKHGVNKQNYSLINKIKKKPTQPIKKVPQIQKIKVSEDESDQGEDLLEMVDQSDLIFLKKAIANKSYNLLNKIRYTE